MTGRRCLTSVRNVAHVPGTIRLISLRLTQSRRPTSEMTTDGSPPRTADPRKAAREARERRRAVLVIGVGMLVGAAAGIGSSVLLVRSSDRTVPSGSVVAAAIAIAAGAAWGAARTLRGEKIVSACAAGLVTALVVSVWWLSGGD